MSIEADERRRARSESGKQGDELFNKAIADSGVQKNIVETLHLAEKYKEALDIQIEAKYNQVARLEDRLENLIEQGGVLLLQLESKQPGLFARPSQRAQWLEQVSQQQVLLQNLQSRLDNVREIKDGMGVYVHRIEELAINKLRFQQPDLVEGWDEMREAERRHQTLIRQAARKSGRARTLNLSQQLL